MQGSNQKDKSWTLANASTVHWLKHAQNILQSRDSLAAEELHQQISHSAVSSRKGYLDFGCILK